MLHKYCVRIRCIEGYHDEFRLSRNIRDTPRGGLEERWRGFRLVRGHRLPEKHLEILRVANRVMRAIVVQQNMNFRRLLGDLVERRKPLAQLVRLVQVIEALAGRLYPRVPGLAIATVKTHD